MRHSPLILRRWSLAAVALATGAVAVSAHSSAGSASALNNALPRSIPRPKTFTRPALRPPSTYIFQTVDDPASTSMNNAVTGINNNNTIVGIYGTECPDGNGGGGGTDPYQSFSATQTGTGWTFATVAYPDTAGTYAGGINNSGALDGSAVITGTACDAKSLNNIYGFNRFEGLWDLLRPASNEGTPPHCHQMHLFGINDLNDVVGYYTDDSCLSHAFTEDQTELNFTPLMKGATNPVATGIDNGGDIVGYAGAASAGYAWFQHGSVVTSPLNFQGNASTPTWAYGMIVSPTSMSAPIEVVGAYVLAGKTHGFLLTDPAGAQTWQSIDDGLVAASTVIYGINANGWICGTYKDTTGKYHGFVAHPAPGALRSNRDPRS